MCLLLLLLLLSVSHLQVQHNIQAAVLASQQRLLAWKKTRIRVALELEHDWIGIESSFVGSGEELTCRYLVAAIKVTYGYPA